MKMLNHILFATALSLSVATAQAESILHPESTAPTDVANEIEQMVLEWAGKFNRGEWVKIQDTWDASEKAPTYLGEERDRWVIGPEGLDSYFNPPAFVRSLMEKVYIAPFRLRVRMVSDDIVIATWENHLDAKVRTRPPIHDTYRVNAYFRKVGDEWMFIHYAELAMAPLTYLEHLYRQNVSEGFPDNAEAYDKNWSIETNEMGYGIGEDVKSD